MALPIAITLGNVLKAVSLWMFLKIVSGMGLGIVTYNLVDVFFEELKVKFLTEYGRLPEIMIRFLELSGCEEGIEIMFSGMAFLIGWYSAGFGFRLVGVLK